MTPPTNLWSETGETLWLRRDLADTPERAKRIAFSGRGLPETILGGEHYGYDYLSVEEVHCRPGDPDERGWAGKGDEMWWRCAADDPRAHAFWEVSVSAGDKP